ncbi:MAG: class I SAM-dependent methyltransferase [Rickettsiales bacterium]|nr:class I SAM-dependent methyltransferase [Rickettsiales bacterium]
MIQQYKFTNGWFSLLVKDVWDEMIPYIKPKRILEVGSYEGASLCYLIDNLAKTENLEIHAIDSWEGGIEHKVGGISESNMSEVEEHFDHNMQIAMSKFPDKIKFFKHKGYSDLELSKLLVDGKKNHFDLIYIDGSHQAPDVLCDAVLAFRLLKVGGFLFFDDYLWSEKSFSEMDLVRCPKPAIDAFTNLYCKKLSIVTAPLSQLYVRKLSD